MAAKGRAFDGMTPSERRATASLGAIYALRMLGLFMILPVFALYAEDLQGMTPLLVGVAVGIYGFTQAMLQIPFGMASDRLGRKPVILFGLALFAIGSVVAAQADTITGVIIGRALQGSGAIAAVIMALAADLSREEHRTKVMAVIGMSIGASFVIALIAGPLLNSWVGVDGIFWLTAVMAVMGMAVVAWITPTPARSTFHRDAQPVPGQFMNVIKDRELVRLDVGILTLHMILTAMFVVLPLSLRDQAGLASESHAWVYLPVMLLAMGSMVPFIIRAEKHRKMKPVFLGAILALTLAQVFLGLFRDEVWQIALGLYIFFTAFNLLEASLPSLIAKLAPPGFKGTAMGVYSSSQFFGAFLGGLIGGWLHGIVGAETVFWFGAAATFGWWLFARGMAVPQHLKSQLLKVDVENESQAQDLALRLGEVPGVAEAVVIVEDGLAYLKVDSALLDEAQLALVVENPNT